MLRPILSFFTATVAALVLAASPASAEQRLTVAGYGGSYEQIMRTSVIPAFERENDVRIDYLTGNSSDNLARMQAQRGNQTVGVAVLDDGPMVQAVSLGLCRKLPDAVRDAVYPIAVLGDDHAVGTGFGFTGIAYNTKLFKERGFLAPTSWMDLAKPEYRQRIAIPGIDNTYGVHTLAMMARIHGGSDSDIAPGLKVMRQQINPNVLAYESSPGKMSEMFQSGEIWLAVWGSSRVAAMQQAGFPLAIARPKEGAVVLMTAGCAIAGSPEPALSDKFLAYFVSPKVQEIFATQYGAGPTNRSTKLPPEVAARVIYGEDQVRSLIGLDWDVVNRNRADWTRQWQRQVER